MAVQVYFVGAGPGAPDLLTLRARDVIERADVVIYADSLIDPEVCSFARKEARVYRSASLMLEETTKIIVSAVENGEIVARLQSGDPSIYGAIQEQMAALDDKGIEYEVVPGISSLFAAAASLKAELTIPELSQTVIITRMGGRTPVPDLERLRSLAAHQCSMAIFLSASLVEQVARELLAGGYQPDAPAAIVYRASWKDEIVVRTTLSDLAMKMRASGVRKQALILVGAFLGSKNTDLRSRLYHGDFKHGYR